MTDPKKGTDHAAMVADEIVVGLADAVDNARDLTEAHLETGEIRVCPDTPGVPSIALRLELIEVRCRGVLERIATLRALLMAREAGPTGRVTVSSRVR